MMQRWIIRARAVYWDSRPVEDRLVVISGKRIESILPSSTAKRFAGRDFISPTRYLVFPGLVDLHCHGGGGVDQNTLGGLLAAAYYHASHGTTALLLTVFFYGMPEFRRLVDMLREARSMAPLHFLGVYLEGPYLNPAVRGSVPLRALRAINLNDIKKIIQAAQGELKIVTLAPELPGAEAAIRAFREAGVVVALGHSLATAEQARQAADWGATLVTHLGNAMRPFHQRDPGLVGAALSEPRLTPEIIADGYHLAPETLTMFLRAKLADSVLISDCRWVAGLAEGQYAQVGEETIVVKNGMAQQTDGTLAGGIHPLWKGVTTVAGLAGFTIWDAIRMVSRNPGKVLGKKNLGRLAVGSRADLILAGPDFSIQRVFFGGEEIFRAANEPPLPA